MKLTVLLVILLAAPCLAVKTVTTRTFVTDPALDMIDISDGISQKEAEQLAEIYFHRFISGCGMPSEPQKKGNDWEFIAYTGLFGTPKEHYIRIDSGNGTVSYHNKLSLQHHNGQWYYERVEQSCSISEVQKPMTRGLYRLDTPLKIELISKEVYFTTNTVPPAYKNAIESIAGRDLSPTDEIITHATNDQFLKSNRLNYMSVANRISSAPKRRNFSSFADLKQTFGDHFGLSCFNLKQQQIEELNATLTWIESEEIRYMLVTVYEYQRADLCCYVITTGKLLPVVQ